MKKILEQFKYSKLLTGRVLGGLNDQEKEQLEAWSSQSKNKAAEKDILNVEAFDDWCAKIESVDKEKGWQQFLDRMVAEKGVSKKPMIKLVRLAASIAAVLVLSLSIYFGYQFLNNQGESVTSIVEVDIKPGAHEAILILDNGKEINLEQESMAAINEDGLSINNTKGVLSYDTAKLVQVQPVINKLKIPRGAEYQIVLSDGTKVWLNSDSELEYSVPFQGKTRRVKLKGEAYFEVTHNAAKPFIVSTGSNDIKVLGTEFDVSAYSEDINVVTTLVKGKVQIDYHLKDKKVVRNYLLPNDQSVFNKQTSDIKKQQVDVSLYTGWKDGRFKFKNEPLESFLTKLARWYNVKVIITDQSIKNMSFTGDIPRYNNMADILNILEAEMSVQIEVEDNKVVYVSR